MRPGETDPKKKRIYFPLFDIDGLPASGEVDEGAVWVPVAGELQVNRDEAGYGDVVDLAAFSHRGNGFYRYEYDDTEIAGLVEGVILLRCKDLAAIRTQVVATPLELGASETESPVSNSSGPFKAALNAAVTIVVWVPTAQDDMTDVTVAIRKPGGAVVALYDGSDLGGDINWVAEIGTDGCWLSILVPAAYTDVSGYVVLNVILDEIPHVNAQAVVEVGIATSVIIGDGSITTASFTDDAQRLLFGILFNGFVEDFADAQVTIFDETPAQNNVYRGCLFHVWKEQGEHQTWVIASNEGNVLTLVGGDAWPVDLVLHDVEDGIPSKVAIIRFGDSIGTMFQEGEAAWTNGRQVVKGMKNAMFVTGGTNIGQPTVGTDAVYLDEAGNEALHSDIDATGAKTTDWTKGAP